MRRVFRTSNLIAACHLAGERGDRTTGLRVVSVLGAQVRGDDFVERSGSALARVLQATLGRVFGRTSDVDEPTTWATRQAQYDAVCDWGIPNHAALQRLSAISHPVFIAAGDSDPMILPHFSHLLAGLIPRALVKIYPDASHGFPFQHASEFGGGVAEFLDDDGSH